MKRLVLDALFPSFSD